MYGLEGIDIYVYTFTTQAHDSFGNDVVVEVVFEATADD